jgi:hypothetical protein
MRFARARAFSLDRLNVFLPFEDSLEITLSMQNANDARYVRLNNVENQDVFKSFYRP